jgi:hypothetical protein
MAVLWPEKSWLIENGWRVAPRPSPISVVALTPPTQMKKYHQPLYHQRYSESEPPRDCEIIAALGG